MSKFGPGGNRIPTFPGEIEDLRREVRKLWSALRSGGASYQLQEVVFWLIPGSLSGLSTTDSPPWIAWDNLELASCTLALATVNNATTTVDILVSDVVVETVTLAAGQATNDATISVVVSLGGKVQARVRSSSSGTGRGLSVTLRWRSKVA